MSEEILTLTFENAADESKSDKTPAISSDRMRDYVEKSAKKVFGKMLPSRVGLTTKDGTIVQNWMDMSVQEVVNEYNTIHFVLGSPDQLG